MPAGSRPLSLLLRHAPLLACAALLVWHALQFGFVTDDAFISFVFSRNLAEHGSLTFNLGDPVEGYTNFLWTFLIGLGMLAGLPPEPTSIALGIGFAIGTLYVSFGLVEHVLGRGARWAYLPPALLALSSGYACWSSGGLETQLFTFLVIAAIYCYARGDGRDDTGNVTPPVWEAGRWLRRAGALLALAAMTRPEGLLVTAVVGLHRLGFNLVRERRLLPDRGELGCLGAFLLLWAPWYAWRWWFYGWPFPNTYYVKAAGPASPGYDATMLSNGLYYVWQWLNQSGVLYALPLIVAGLVVARPRSRRFFAGTLLLGLGAIYAVYTIKVGGDFMGLHRFIMPLFPIAAIGTALGLALLSGLVARLVWPVRDDGQSGPRGVAAGAVGGVLAAALILGFGWSQQRLTRDSLRWGNFANDHGIDTPAFLRAYTDDRATIGKHMAACFRPDDFSIVGGAGAQPYYGRMRSIDVFGLVSSRIAHDVPRTRPRAGHNKWGPDELLAGYDPDFVFSCYSIHRRPDDASLNCNPGYWLRKGYEKVTLHIPGLRQQGEYYTFLVRKARQFDCPGRVP